MEGKPAERENRAQAEAPAPERAGGLAGLVNVHVLLAPKRRESPVPHGCGTGIEAAGAGRLILDDGPGFPGARVLARIHVKATRGGEGSKVAASAVIGVADDIVAARRNEAPFFPASGVGGRGDIPVGGGVQGLQVAVSAMRVVAHVEEAAAGIDKAPALPRRRARRGVNVPAFAGIARAEVTRAVGGVAEVIPGARIGEGTRTAGPDGDVVVGRPHFDFVDIEEFLGVDAGPVWRAAVLTEFQVGDLRDVYEHPTGSFVFDGVAPARGSYPDFDESVVVERPTRLDDEVGPLAASDGAEIDAVFADAGGAGGAVVGIFINVIPTTTVDLDAVPGTLGPVGDFGIPLGSLHHEGDGAGVVVGGWIQAEAVEALVAGGGVVAAFFAKLGAALAFFQDGARGAAAKSGGGGDGRETDRARAPLGGGDARSAFHVQGAVPVVVVKVFAPDEGGGEAWGKR